MIGPWLNVPNVFTVLRMVTVVLMLTASWMGERSWFVGLLCFALFTDFADGWTARHFHQSSKLGSLLDSTADFATFVSLPLCVWWLWPEIMRREAPYVIACVVSFVTPAVAGLLKFGRLQSFHTWGAKFCTASMGVAMVLLLLDVTAWPFRILTPIVVLEALEELAMTAILPRWHPNVPSLWHALRVRREPPEG